MSAKPVGRLALKERYSDSSNVGSNIGIDVKIEEVTVTIQADITDIGKA